MAKFDGFPSREAVTRRRTRWPGVPSVALRLEAAAATRERAEVPAGVRREPRRPEEPRRAA